jgi:hypothetical protein
MRALPIAVVIGQPLLVSTLDEARSPAPDRGPRWKKKEFGVHVSQSQTASVALGLPTKKYLEGRAPGLHLYPSRGGWHKKTVKQSFSVQSAATTN